MGQVPLCPRLRPDPRGLWEAPDPAEGEGRPVLGGDGHLHRGGPPAAMLRWRKKGAEPSGGAMLALAALAEQVPGGIDILMGRDPAVMAGERE